MAITKTDFINYSRCRRYAALDDVRKEKLLSDINYKDYKALELEEKRKEFLDSIFGDESYEVDLTKELNVQMEAMMPYYKQVEIEAGAICERYFPGTFHYAEKTEDQEYFECVINNIKYVCYVDIYNEYENVVNIIEVKATTTTNWLGMEAGHRGKEKYCIWHKENNTLRLKDEIDNYPLDSEMDYKNFITKKQKLFDRYSGVGKYVFDLAVQRYIIEHEYKASNNEGALKNIKYYLAVLNNKYEYDGNGEYKNINGEELLTFIDLTKVTEEYQERIDICRQNIEMYLDKMDASPCFLTESCGRKKTTECVYFSKICGNIIPQKNSVFNYLNCTSFKDETGTSKKILELINEGYVNMLDIPESWIKSKKHMIQRDAVAFDRIHVDKEKIIKGLSVIKYPIYHLDFETFPCPIPRFKGEKPYSQSPFEFSLHIEREPGKCDFDKDNYVFLAKSFKDEREELVKALIEHIDGSKGTMFAQNCSFEMSCIKNLAKNFPEYREKLLQINSNVMDLLWLVNTNRDLYQSLGFSEEESSLPNYYSKYLSGSFSIKKTLPAFTDLSYASLDVKNGMEAIATYANYPNMSKEEYNLKYQALITYCKQDTWAMVLILDALRKLVK